MIKQFIAQNITMGGVKVTLDPGVLDGIALNGSIHLEYMTYDYSIQNTLEIIQNSFTKSTNTIQEKVFTADGWGIIIQIPNARGARDYYKYQIEVYGDGKLLGTGGGQQEDDLLDFAILCENPIGKTIDIKVIYTDNYVCDEDVKINLASGANTQIFCPSFMPDTQYKFIFELGELITDDLKGTTPAPGKYITEAKPIVNGNNTMFVPEFLHNRLAILYLTYDSDDNIYFHSGSEGFGLYRSVTLTGVIAVKQTNKKYTCTQCGYVYEGTAAPSACPVCRGTDFVTT